MGARGPGAKPTRKDGPAPQRPWQAPRLARATRVIRFIEGLSCTQGKGAGKPFRLRPWQKAIVRKVYDRERTVTEALMTCARKNGKTELAAALALCHLAGPEAVLRGEVFSAAQGRNEASRIFRSIEAFIMADEDLSARCNIQRFAKRIEVMHGPGAGSTFDALSSDASKAHGLFPSFVVADELAQWRGRELFDNLRTGMGGEREQPPLLWIISTKSADQHSVMWEMTEYARKVRDGVLEDPTFAPFVFEVPDDVDPLEDESSWKLANPALGDFRSLKEMRTEAEKARRIPGRASAFRRLYCNQAKEDEADRFIRVEEWLDCQHDYAAEDLAGQRCYGGLDLGSTRDLTSFALYFPDADGATLSWSWCPADHIEQRSETDRVPYLDWVEAGHIEATPGRATNKRAVVLKLAELVQTYSVQAIAFDPWGMPEVERILDEEGIVLPLKKHPQAYSEMSPSLTAFEEQVLNRELRHNGNPVLTWALTNVTLSSDASGNRRPDKARARERIDPVVALIMAVGIHAREPAERAYDFSGPRVITAA